MAYTPHTSQDIEQMLQVIGVESIEQLFEDIPTPLRLKGLLQIPEPLSEQEVVEHLEGKASQNRIFPASASFLGGGSYRHYVPAIVDHLISRSEFYTAYTPYQPEISQGTLQAIFEFQSLICFLTAMDVANASMYDGASATAEATLMAMRISRKQKILCSAGLHPHYQTVLSTYVKHQGATIVSIEPERDGCCSLSTVTDFLDDQTAAVVMQYPNFFGIVQDFSALAEEIHRRKAILIVVVPEALALGLLTPPGEMGADIVVGEGQSFGIPTQFGGPYVGFMSTSQKYLRQMPGRLVGQTVDTEGRRGFVLTLSTREQHIRREKATSNICTNQGLCALAATIAMTVLGKEGLSELARINFSKSEYLKNQLSTIDGVTFPFAGPHFNEFVIETPYFARDIIQAGKKKGLIPGFALDRMYPGMEKNLLINVTEVNKKSDIDRLVELISTFSG